MEIPLNPDPTPHKAHIMQESERERALLRLLDESGSARIEALARQLGVTDETIRRTAKRLEVRGLVTRVHGGLHLKDWHSEPSFARRIVQNREAKRRIAAKVAEVVADGTALMLDVGSTTAHVAQALRQRRDLTVITNSLPVAQALAGHNGNRVYMAGGELRPHDGGTFGDEALAFLRQFRVQLAVLSVAAIDAPAGFMLQDLREAEFSRAMLSCAEAAIVCADASKFARRAPIRVADPAAIGRLVTDQPPPAPLSDWLAAAGVDVLLADADPSA